MAGRLHRALRRGGARRANPNPNPNPNANPNPNPNLNPNPNVNPNPHPHPHPNPNRNPNPNPNPNPEQVGVVLPLLQLLPLLAVGWLVCLAFRDLRRSRKHRRPPPYNILPG